MDRSSRSWPVGRIADQGRRSHGERFRCSVQPVGHSENKQA
ncbi:hypothetical protein KPATCC21470_1452 [Kitasatospora purpeofusca]